MYQVIKIYGENEPWWFFDDWEKDIVDKSEFEDFNQAKEYFAEMFCELKSQNDHLSEKPGFLIAFWREGNTHFCEECDDDVQLFHGLMMLKDNQKIVVDGKGKDETINYSGKAKCCKRFSKSAWSKSKK